MGNWRAGIFFIAILASIIIVLLSSQNYTTYYSPQILDSTEKNSLKNNKFNFDEKMQTLSCPSKNEKDIVGYGVDIIKLADEVSTEECLIMNVNANSEIKTASLGSAKSRAIEACKDSIPNVDFTCGNSPCVDCQRIVGSSSCDDVHDNKIEAVSLAHADGKGICSMKASASAWGKVSISCESEVCIN